MKKKIKNIALIYCKINYDSIETVAYERTLAINRFLKKHFQGLIFCAGGIHTTALPGQTYNDMHPDFLIIGEGEFSFRQVIEKINSS